MPELAQILAGYKGKGYVIAPAGYGKTRLIAMAVKESNDRQLILTHTYAGVNALKNKMQELGVQSSKYHIDTIASWSLRICIAYPHNSGWNIEYPENSVQWTELYKKTANLLKKDFIKRIVLATYSGVFVDEYQDCSVTQHETILSLAEIIPCRILGDPLQAIFDFGDQPVSWKESIYPVFNRLGSLEIPWRWINSGSGDIGKWLVDIRKDIREKGKVDLSRNLPKNVTLRSEYPEDFLDEHRFNCFYDLARKHANDSIVVIYPGTPKFKNKTHKLACRLGGQYSSIEEVEGDALFVFIKRIMKDITPSKKLLEVIEFAKRCMTSVEGVLTAGTKRGEVAIISKNTKCPEITRAANNFLSDESSENIRKFFMLLRDNSETKIFRRDLFNRVLRVLDIHSHSINISLQDAAKIYQNEFRNNGRPLKHNKIIGTTLLLKGLEYDHAIIVDAPSFSRKHLYVALTRASKSITIITKEKILQNLA